MVIKAIRSFDPDCSSKGMLVEDIKQELQSPQQWHMSFVRREDNRGAHTLSKLATKNFMDK